MSSSIPCPPAPSVGASGLSARLRSWWTIETLGRQFWAFFIAAFFFDLCVGLYFFLFNLFLLNLHFDERSMGMISAALTVGNVMGTIPVGLMARRYGTQKLLLFCFVAAPIVLICRTTSAWMPAQIALAFLAGVTLSSWPVCFAPTIASLTNENNRVFAFSISFATGIGTGALAGIAGGFLPQILQRWHLAANATSAMRLVLIVASLVPMVGLYPISIIKQGKPEVAAREKRPIFHPYLRRFLPAFAVSSIVSGSFIPFAPVFFQKKLGMPLNHVGEVFSASQLAQFFAVLIVPLLFRRAGSVASILWAQVLSGVLIVGLALSHTAPFTIALYLAYTAVQFTTGPGFYGTLMSRLPEADRSSASAVQNIVGALSQAGSVALTGILVVRLGYGFVFDADAILALVAALLVLQLPKAAGRQADPLQ